MFTLSRIQRLWRGYLTRKMVKTMKNEELIFIGMVNLGDHSNRFFMKYFGAQKLRHQLVCPSVSENLSLIAALVLILDFTLLRRYYCNFS